VTKDKGNENEKETSIQDMPVRFLEDRRKQRKLGPALGEVN
jgi:hypothetical protein